MLRPALSVLDTRIARPAPKEADEVYKTAGHRRWAAEVIRRAGGRCQWPGCDRMAPEYRMVADHIREIKDGGAPLDPANGQCLCVKHNTIKGLQARRQRDREGAGFKS